MKTMLTVLALTLWGGSLQAQAVKWEYAEYTHATTPSGESVMVLWVPGNGVPAAGKMDSVLTALTKRPVEKAIEMNFFNYVGNLGWELISCKESRETLQYNVCVFKRRKP